MAKTMADVMREQGIAEGIEQGIAEGIEQGETRAKQESVLKLLQHRFNDIPQDISEQVSDISSIPHLDALFEVIFEADTLEDIDWQLEDNNE